ncbi:MULTISPECIES: DUF485 domain-containing protein [unclassified Streptomyces]|uniref:DUF485 domain-containing protein n=1 Tax=unclassified Streptomyces TaxID=2593676 RepID=UPI0022B73BE2|nr:MULTISPECIES: DUF485 domain-containing protein [unclassified Streptomyces]MCZ7413724.1 DUF485 domain-containing protein [Streptomyces sp. WMMC897]MCZ7430720.1 DUF485 domain-containing protein [Streptomyces sp. WMMC1477]
MSPDLPPQSRSPEAAEEDRTVAMHTDPRFVELKRRLVVFVFPMSVAFLVWYLLYVLMSAYARGVMSTVVFGTVNVALVFGVLQFVSTFGIAVLYSRYANRRLDALADSLRGELGGPDAAASAAHPVPQDSERPA